jgi:hypothetical protein
VDRALQRLAPERMTNGVETLLTIERICGFEEFGGYENWDAGYRITQDDVVVRAKWLDVALYKLAEKKGLIE